MKRSLFLLTFFLLTLNACNGDDNNDSSASLEDVAGQYTLGEGSYAAPYDVETDTELDDTKHIDLSGEVITVSLTSENALVIESDTLGEFMAQATVLGRFVVLQVPDQNYVGNLLDVEETLGLRGTLPLFFEKQSSGTWIIGEAAMEVTIPKAPLIPLAKLDIEGTDRNKYYISMKKGPGLR